MDPKMTRKIALLIFFASIFLLQTISCQVHGQSPPNFVQNDNGVALYDVNGHPIVNPAVETEGFPLFLPKWKLGWLRLADNRLFPGVPLELDLERQKVYYKRPDGTVIEVEAGQVKDLALQDTIAGSIVAYQFACGFPSIDNQSATSFYLVLDTGRVAFLESMRKRLYQEKDEFGGNDKREYRIYTDFYVFYRGKIARIKKDPDFFLTLTSDKHDQMQDYLKKNTVSFKSTEDIRKFVHYYNGLP